MGKNWTEKNATLSKKLTQFFIQFLMPQNITKRFNFDVSLQFLGHINHDVTLETERKNKRQEEKEIEKKRRKKESGIERKIEREKKNGIQRKEIESEGKYGTGIPLEYHLLYFEYADFSKTIFLQITDFFYVSLP